MDDIQTTIDEYAQTVCVFDDNISLWPNRSKRMKTRGSKAVLSALRALQNKISTMNNANIDCEERYNYKINKLNKENRTLNDQNDKYKLQIKQLIKLNQNLTSKLKISSQKEEKAMQIAQNAEHKLQQNDNKMETLQIEIEKLQNTTNQKKKIQDAIKIYIEQIEKSKVNISILKDEIYRQRQLKESMLKRKEKSDQLISEMIQENEKLHSKILRLQKFKISSTRKNNYENDRNSITINLSPKTIKKYKIKRSKSTHSIKKKHNKSNCNKKPFMPTGKLNRSFSRVQYPSSVHQTKHKRKCKIRSRVSKPMKSRKKIKCFLPKSAVSDQIDNDKYIAKLLKALNPSKNVNIFDGLDIDDIQID
eukprot:170394_1